MTLNARLTRYETSGTPARGQSFTHQLWLENSGTRPWTNAFTLTYLGAYHPHQLHPSQESYPLPLTPPGQTAQLTVTLTAVGEPGDTYSFWQLRDPDQQPFGGFIGLQVTLTGTAVPPFNPDDWRKVVFSITSIFESGNPNGRPEAYQTYDAGIISYGKHQATLAAGTLGEVMQRYWELSQTPTSRTLHADYGQRILNRDASLRHDERLKTLLLEAATDPAMIQAQDDVFARLFYTPAVRKTRQLGLQTPLGLACIYDMMIQHGPGGADHILKQLPTLGSLPEAGWLAALLDKREAHLNHLADRNEQNGKTVNARALRNSTYRVRELRALLQQGNLTLSGTLTVRHISFPGL